MNVIKVIKMMVIEDAEAREDGMPVLFPFYQLFIGKNRTLKT